MLRSPGAPPLKRLVLLAALALVGCQPKPPAQVTAVSAITRFSPPIHALGTEPFWSADLKGDRLTITRPDHPPLTARAKLKQLTANWAVWEARTADGRSLRFAAVSDDCSDGMSDRTYPLGVEIAFEGEILKGCASRG